MLYPIHAMSILCKLWKESRQSPLTSNRWTQKLPQNPGPRWECEHNCKRVKPVIHYWTSHNACPRMGRGIKGTIRRLNKEKLVIIFLFNERLITKILYLPKIRILISMAICCGPIWYPWWYVVVLFDIHGDMLLSYLISMVICWGLIVCSMVWCERWLFALVVLMELLVITFCPYSNIAFNFIPRNNYINKQICSD